MKTEAFLDRLTSIEIALTRHEKDIEELQDELLRQSRIIDKLQSENKLLISVLKESSVKPLSQETKPPHY